MDPAVKVAQTREPSGRWVGDSASWRDVEKALGRSERIGLDLESDGFHHYQARICLVQVALDDGVFLIDPGSVPSLSVLGRVLRDPAVEVVMHSADYDIRSLDRDFGFRVANLFDCSIAAAFVGMSSLGLGTVLGEILGVEVQKSKRLQRFDWSRRPLPDDALFYAAGDVAHLFALSRELKRRLTKLGRTEWVDEECRRLTGVRFESPPPAEEAFFKAKGAVSLSPRERAVFREIFLFRDRLARERDLPPFKILGNEALLALARDPAGELRKTKGISETFLRHHGSGLRAAVRDGLSAPPVPRPRRDTAGYRRATAAEKARLDALKQWRQQTGASLGLDPALVWPLKHLEYLANHNGTEEAARASSDAMGVRAWQEREFGEALRERLVSIRETGVRD